MIEIPLKGLRGEVRAVAKVDAADAHLASFNWHLTSRGYAARTDRTSGPKRTIWMHRVVARVGDRRVQVDHINRDKLDNRRANLRIATNAENGQNRDAYEGGTSRFRGVSWKPSKNRWVAHAWIDGRTVHVGYFTDEVEAARAVDRYRLEHMPFARPDQALVELPA